MKHKAFQSFMSGAVESASPDPGAVRQAGYIPFSSDRMPTRKQVAAALTQQPQCPQELGAETCECRDHRGDLIHGFREYGGRPTGDGSNPFPPGSAGAMQFVDVERVNAQIVAAVGAAREVENQIDMREAAAYAAANAPMALAEAEQALADEMRRVREETEGWSAS